MAELKPILPTTSVMEWYDANARALPWRIPPNSNAKPDPYKIWLSEVMLQQTTIPHGTRYFLDFTARWPTVFDLASAPSEEIMAAWAGLGYYARARNLHKCAKAVAAMGAFPETYEGLLSLPGIGPYTAGAIAAIAFAENVPVVDGNVERVSSRFLALEKPVRDAKPVIREFIAAAVPGGRPGDFAQAMMDLGATVCTPRNPNCADCPISNFCLALKQGQVSTYPVKPPKKEKPERIGYAYIVRKGDEILLERRAEKGLLGGMLGLPTTDWLESSDWQLINEVVGFERSSEIGEVTHVFTHFRLTLKVKRLEIDNNVSWEGEWYPAESIGNAGLPSVFLKAARLGSGLL